MKRSRFVGLVVAGATVVASVFAATTSTAAAAGAAPSAAQSTAFSTSVSQSRSSRSKARLWSPQVGRSRRPKAAHGARTTQSASATCNVLNLTLGPLHLALLGLIVDLNKGSSSTSPGKPLCSLAGGVPGAAG
jgi:hypothetical protein